jgi:hypothetical protein
VIEQLLGKFSLEESTPAVRKVGLWVTNLVSMREEESQIRRQRTILDYMPIPSSDI